MPLVCKRYVFKSHPLEDRGIVKALHCIQNFDASQVTFRVIIGSCAFGQKLGRDSGFP